jgi:hypothetical protein
MITSTQKRELDNSSKPGEDDKQPGSIPSDTRKCDGIVKLIKLIKMDYMMLYFIFYIYILFYTSHQCYFCQSFWL